MGDSFEGVLFRWTGAGAWTFVRVPAGMAPPPSAPWGRAPVRATVDGRSWDTSVWSSREYGPLLAVPAKLRAGKGDGDTVTVRITPRLG